MAEQGWIRVGATKEMKTDLSACNISYLNQAEEKPGSRGLMQKKGVGKRYSGHGGAVRGGTWLTQQVCCCFSSKAEFNGLKGQTGNVL